MNKSTEQKNTTESSSTQKSEQDSIPVEVSRTINAPIENIWAAFSQPSLVKLWWGPEQFTCPKAELDFTEGGKYLYAMKSPEGDVAYSTGTFEKITPNERIVMTDSFSDAEGNVVTPARAGMKDWPDDFQSKATFDFQELNEDEVLLTLHHVGIPASKHDECVGGWESTFNKLQKLVEQKRQ